MTTPKIVFLDRITIPGHISIPELSFEHKWINYDLTAPDEVAERIKDADIVVANKVPLNVQTLAGNETVKLIALTATGFNNVDIAYCREHNIAVTNIRGYASQSVPEHAMAMIFTLMRNLRGYQQDIEDGEWLRQGLFCFFTRSINDIAGATIGIVGSGELGQAMAKLARAVGMNVIFAERKGSETCREGYLPFEDVLAIADVLSLHCPLNNDTYNLISGAELKAMKPKAVLINTGRGGLVDEQALVDALISGEIGGAAADVFTQEPADKRNPLIAHAGLPNLILTPHVAWGSDSALNKMMQILVDNIEAFRDGKELNRVV
ncbi:glycerate dehydrogenase [Vibrio sp. HA2012]|uniref:D-2-hydroxyacid dehydrogenase n=1 Tax=Vibrio sp. HA2012 TaxID=1971595 RepID=UPI000C2BEC20|nr:D-2-hydroxyacid dehydrogenase [Vibrio sp. HA2012]PJC85809.1 glycerate dehydrogenase [Vibrio sp. HA2012]